MKNLITIAILLLSTNLNANTQDFINSTACLITYQYVEGNIKPPSNEYKEAFERYVHLSQTLTKTELITLPLDGAVTYIATEKTIKKKFPTVPEWQIPLIMRDILCPINQTQNKTNN